jgi:hypothetical protein
MIMTPKPSFMALFSLAVVFFSSLESAYALPSVIDDSDDLVSRDLLYGEFEIYESRDVLDTRTADAYVRTTLKRRDGGKGSGMQTSQQNPQPPPLIPGVTIPDIR